MARWRRILLVAVVMAGVVGCIAWFASERVERVLGRAQRTQDLAAFQRWLGQDSSHARDYTAFDSYLAEQGVRGVVPTWQLVRGDGSPGAACTGHPFEVPPRAFWPNVVPVLQFVRKEIVPRTGPLEANSAWRSAKANRCARGASNSRHLTFSGIDFVARRKIENRALFKMLCELQAELGPRSRFGLGAYFDPSSPDKNAKGQFHVDLSGYRSWGFGYGARTSGCRAFASG